MRKVPSISGYGKKPTESVIMCGITVKPSVIEE
jgi:hypothetical protein